MEQEKVFGCVKNVGQRHRLGGLGLYRGENYVHQEKLATQDNNSSNRVPTTPASFLQLMVLPHTLMDEERPGEETLE